jgi:hypothetical protein
LRVPPIPLVKLVQSESNDELRNSLASKPIMPKANDKNRKKILIAKPAMTLAGFKHDKKILQKKHRLNQTKTAAEVEI